MGNLVGPRELFGRIIFWLQADRLGPDFPLTHWRLHFKSLGKKLCKKKFRKFGSGAEFRPGAYAEACSKISIGKDVIIRPGTFLFADPTPGGGDIVIEDSVLVAPGVHFYTNNHAYSDTSMPIMYQGYPSASLDDSITIRTGSWIGAGAIILPGVTIGENSVVAAGSVVTKSIPPCVIVAGNPASIIRKLT